MPRAVAFRRSSVLAGLAPFALLVALAPPGAMAAPGTNTDKCHQAIAIYRSTIKEGRVSQVSRCLKHGNYDDCSVVHGHITSHETDVRNQIAGPGSSCRAAIEMDGAVLSDFGPIACADEWNDCDVAVPAIDSLENLAECLICQEYGYDQFLRSQIGIPRPVPTDSDERRCTIAVARQTGHTVRKGTQETARCARGGSKPFDCSFDDSPESRFGKALSIVARKVAACRVDEGEAPGALTNLCGGGASNQAELTACFVGVAKCLTCRTANSTLEQADDCAALSGLAECDGSF